MLLILPICNSLLANFLMGMLMLSNVRSFLAHFTVDSKTPEWKPGVFFQKRRLISGDHAAGVLMTRVVNGQRFYRAMTVEEEQLFREDTSL